MKIFKTFHTGLTANFWSKRSNLNLVKILEEKLSKSTLVTLLKLVEVENHREEPQSLLITSPEVYNRPEKCLP